MQTIVTLLLGLISGILLTVARHYIVKFLNRTKLSITVYSKETYWGNPIMGNHGEYVGYSHNQLIPTLEIINRNRQNRVRANRVTLKVWDKANKKLVTSEVMTRDVNQDVNQDDKPLEQGDVLIIKTNPDQIRKVLSTYCGNEQTWISFSLQDSISEREFCSPPESYRANDFEIWSSKPS